MSIPRVPGFIRSGFDTATNPAERRADIDLRRLISAKGTLTYGTMASGTTVTVDGESTARTIPKLTSAGALVATDRVALLQTGSDALILGKFA